MNFDLIHDLILARKVNIRELKKKYILKSVPTYQSGHPTSKFERNPWNKYGDNCDADDEQTNNKMNNRRRTNIKCMSSANRILGY